MRSKFKIVLVMLFAGSLNVFAQTSSPELRSTFQELENKWNKALVDADLNTLVSFYVDDAISLPSYTPMMRGIEEIRSGNQKDLAETKYVSLNANTTDVLSAGNIAIEIGTYDISLIPAKMSEPIKDHGKYLTIWQHQQDGSWKIKCDTFNTDMPPMSNTQAGAKEKPWEDMKDMGKDKENDH